MSSGEWSLFEFENLSNQIEMPSLTSQVLKDEFVIREWYDGDVKPAVVRYMPVSSMVSAVSSMILANVPDAGFPAAGLSSIQTRTLDGGSKVLELYNFHNPAVDTVYLSAQNRYEFIMRDNADHCVKYANLSGIGGEVTLSGTDGSSGTGSKWKFEAFANSNISVHISP